MNTHSLCLPAACVTLIVGLLVPDAIRAQSKAAPAGTAPPGANTAVPSQPTSPDVKSVPPALKSLADELSRQLKADFPQAEVKVDGNELRVRYLTRKFMVHGQYRTGEYTDDPREEEGPKNRGFLLHAYFHSEQPVSALVVPCELHEPYWMTYVNHYEIGAGKSAGYVTVRLSHNRGTDPLLLEKLKAILAGNDKTTR